MNNCPICGKEKKESNKFCSLSCRNIQINLNKKLNGLYKTQGQTSLKTKFGEFVQYEIECSNPKCNKLIYIKERSKQIDKTKRRFCSRSCSNSRIFSVETIELKRLSAIKNNPLREDQICICCGDKFYHKHKGRKTCSLLCRKSHNLSLVTKNSKTYRVACQFAFSLKSYPEEFDFKLLELHGLYSPKNKKNNLVGVSRDHMFSIAEGFIKNIDPSIIKHPANCRLILHSENLKKKTDSCLSLEELLKRIENWDNKYGPDPEGREPHLQ